MPCTGNRTSVGHFAGKPDCWLSIRAQCSRAKRTPAARSAQGNAACRRIQSISRAKRGLRLAGVGCQARVSHLGIDRADTGLLAIPIAGGPAAPHARERSARRPARVSKENAAKRRVQSAMPRRAKLSVCRCWVPGAGVPHCWQAFSSVDLPCQSAREAHADRHGHVNAAKRRVRSLRRAVRGQRLAGTVGEPVIPAKRAAVTCRQATD